ncbi:MAG: hypothetical protein GF409_04575 [Candidatus Omnitrophica bacterium]|nr:hypothetical protein [Candidatus Omnitrophota bacterium]
MKMSLGVGVLVLLGLVLILFGVIFKLSGLNLLEPQIKEVTNFFIVANTCLLLALIVAKFDTSEEE